MPATRSIMAVTMSLPWVELRSSTPMYLSLLRRSPEFCTRLPLAAVSARAVLAALRAKMLKALLRMHLTRQRLFVMAGEAEFKVLNDVPEIQNVFQEFDGQFHVLNRFG
ncbi:MAG: hypothetical protein EGQ34_01445 [Sutterella sp.]|nr:hypothetical protein [Sutterella sp.]